MKFKQLLKIKSIDWWIFKYNIIYRQPFRTFKELYWAFQHRFNPKHRYNYVFTGLKPGYYDSDYRMLYACFSLLKEFVEKELAWMYYICSDSVKNEKPWFMSDSKWINDPLNCGRYGLSYLDSEMKLRMELDDEGCMTKGDLQINHEGTQGWAAKEMKELYIWWVHERDKERNYKEDYNFEKEEALDRKEEKQLLRLMKVRTRMWT